MHMLFGSKKKSLFVVEPSPQSVWTSGTQVLVSWSHGGNRGNAKLELYKGGRPVHVLLDPVELVTGEVRVQLPPGLQPAPDYRVRLTRHYPDAHKVGLVSCRLIADEAPDARLTCFSWLGGLSLIGYSKTIRVAFVD